MIRMSILGLPIHRECAAQIANGKEEKYGKL